MVLDRILFSGKKRESFLRKRVYTISGTQAGYYTMVTVEMPYRVQTDGVWVYPKRVLTFIKYANIKIKVKKYIKIKIKLKLKNILK
jgi:hypothetical protein